jgi:hypothetical protein
MLEGCGPLGKMVGKVGEKVLDISWKVTGVGQVCMVLSQHFSNSSICIVSVFPDIAAVTPPFKASPYFFLLLLFS